MSSRKTKTTFHTGKPFSKLTATEKLRFVGKALVFFVSGGFIFPTMWID